MGRPCRQPNDRAASAARRCAAHVPTPLALDFFALGSFRALRAQSAGLSPRYRRQNTRTAGGGRPLARRIAREAAVHYLFPPRVHSLREALCPIRNHSSDLGHRRSFPEATSALKRAPIRGRRGIGIGHRNSEQLDPGKTVQTWALETPTYIIKRSRRKVQWPQQTLRYTTRS